MGFVEDMFLYEILYVLGVVLALALVDDVVNELCWHVGHLDPFVVAVLPCALEVGLAVGSELFDAAREFREALVVGIGWIFGT